MQCPGCGAELGSTARFCENCGAPVSRACSNCGAQVSTTANFCQTCGAKLDLAPGPQSPSAARAAPAADAERRQLTVMFCDLVGSTALSERLDPEELRELMQAYQRACREVISRYEGHIAQYLGDGLMVYFGWPQGHEDAATRAIRAALEVSQAVSGLTASTPVSARVGIHTGLVVIGETGRCDASIPKAAVPASAITVS